MDESGGSGQPRSGDEDKAERHATPATPATGPARPPRQATGSDEPSTPPVDEPTMVVRRLHLPDEGPAGDTAEKRGADGQEAKGEQPRPSRTDGRQAGAADAADRAAPAKDTRDPAPDSRAATGRTDAPRPDADGPTAATPAPAPPHSDRPAPTPEGRPQDVHGPAPLPGPLPQHTAEAHRTLAHSGTKGQPPRPPEPRGGLLMGRPFGVPVYVAPSWFLVAALITWVFGGQLDRVLPELGAARYLVSLFFAVAFYASVLVHELAHTVAALRFKLPVRRIQLQFFGGVSEIEKETETPGREFVLAFVGPLLSLVLAGVFYAAMQTVEPGTVPGVLLAGLMISNLIVAAFNLLPGLPLDGGRMLRAVVWKITGKPMSGTIAAAWVGRALAVSVLVGLPWLTQSGALGSEAVDDIGMDTVMDALLAAILAAIIWTGAGNSLRMARLREHLPDLRARALTRRAVPVESDTPLSEALRRANTAGARALVVVDADGNPLSLVREAAIVGVPEHRRPWVAVSSLAQELTEGMRVSAELAGEELLDALRATPATEYLVVEETGEIYGVLSAADVERAFVKAMARPS
ncbi:site-2 protease family protein [Streptomyces sp. ISL-22]|uniref:site-2 protease family protein n=1 Tax=unclassified Streptomyces TaxID=2593676 RepID=UPI001BE59EB2|nr:MULTISPECIES: site-2 protease family protein [unclassified Streptomyces]MBT2422078.1 site-2 protease family protein [Streptomyces sp. ISL-24]MBT2437387.1 site-2 protease family protein [Streptomyces sp. ISL-22]